MSHSNLVTESSNMMMGILAVSLALTSSIPSLSRSSASLPMASAGSEILEPPGIARHMSRSELGEPKPLRELPKTWSSVPSGKALHLLTISCSLRRTVSLSSSNPGLGDFSFIFCSISLVNESSLGVRLRPLGVKPSTSIWCIKRSLPAGANDSLRLHQGSKDFLMLSIWSPLKRAVTEGLLTAALRACATANCTSLCFLSKASFSFHLSLLISSIESLLTCPSPSPIAIVSS
mmetsp:Transcript_22915/g.47521  ORF Transcript_22915/g.47521 Transcript_22915/m.47521 type:complete len:233 (+) Transcript_22915:766-1464(+)